MLVLMYKDRKRGVGGQYLIISISVVIVIVPSPLVSNPTHLVTSAVLSCGFVVIFDLLLIINFPLYPLASSSFHPSSSSQISFPYLSYHVRLLLLLFSFLVLVLLFSEGAIIVVFKVPKAL